MAYHIASDEEILDAVRKVLENHHTVTSQHVLKNLVERELQMKKQRVHVSEHRLRVLVVRSGLAQVEIHTREGDPDRLMYNCPVCNGVLHRVKNATIYGGEVTLEYRCGVCGYWTGKKKKIPTLYIFHSA
ncbi:MAG TPA: hypothetical protein VMT57_05085 [Candidatus Thermoplasmatota archaeon]|nr:hypothetical protein [Candidatus Thermoplasmatota archaeon]